jgi:hypothetical protein
MDNALLIVGWIVLPWTKFLPSHHIHQLPVRINLAKSKLFKEPSDLDLFIISAIAIDPINQCLRSVLIIRLLFKFCLKTILIWASLVLGPGELALHIL